MKMTKKVKNTLWLSAVLGGIVILLVIFLIIPQSKQLVAREQCFASSNSVTIGDQKGMEYNFFRTTLQNNIARGSFETYPFGKDALVGSFEGAFAELEEGHVLNVAFAYRGDTGTNVIEERYVVIQDDIANIAFGEMEERADGIYGYKDRDNLAYWLAIPQVACEEYDALLEERERRQLQTQ